MADRTLPHPSSPEAPKYWTMETSGRLRNAMVRYLDGLIAFPGDSELIRDYLDQWVASPAWDMNPHQDDHGRMSLQSMREQVKGLKCRSDFDRFIEELTHRGMDPL